MAEPALGRLLQAAADEPGLGAGLILLIIFGILALVASVLACGRGPVIRVTIVFASWSCYLLLVLVLVFLPREPRIPSAVDLSLVTDIDTFLRALFVIFVFICALLGVLMVLLQHAMAPQKAPHAPDIERPELVRLAR